jgi:hypothetical protein
MAALVPTAGDQSDPFGTHRQLRGPLRGGHRCHRKARHETCSPPISASGIMFRRASGCFTHCQGTELSDETRAVDCPHGGR